MVIISCFVNTCELDNCVSRKKNSQEKVYYWRDDVKDWGSAAEKRKNEKDEDECSVAFKKKIHLNGIFGRKEAY